MCDLLDSKGDILTVPMRRYITEEGDCCDTIREKYAAL